MSDARALLRAQRAARRVEHPHAQYTDAGKLTCAVCREAIKSEGLWENHTRSASHRQRLLAQQKAKAKPQPRQPSPPPPSNKHNGAASKPSTSDTLSDEALMAQIIGGGSSNSAAGHKRKHSEDADVDMADPSAEEGGSSKAYDQEQEAADAVRRKRSKQDMGTTPTSASINTSVAAAGGMFSHSTIARNGSPMKTDSPPVGTPPPGLVRRSSGTPSHGVELQIPSRPATPSASHTTPLTSTPNKANPFGRSPLEDQMAHPRQVPRANFATSAPSAAAAAATATTAIPQSDNSTMAANTADETVTAAAAQDNNDDDWATFEAEVVHAAPSATTTAAIIADNDAVISAAPLTAEQLAAKSEEEERAKRRAAAEIEIEDEQEEAKRALEAEFEEMEELEARVRKLKEKREAIRRGSVSAAAAAATTTTSAANTGEVLNGTSLSGADAIKEAKEEDEDSDEDDDDDWAGFRFRG